MTESKVKLIIGKRGSGKTVLAKHLAKDESKLFVYDTLHEFTDGVIFDDLAQCCAFWKKVYIHPFKIVYRPINPEADFGKICELAFALGNLCLYVEEIDIFGSAYAIDPNFANIIQRGRHKNITLVGVTQRPFGIHRLLTAQTKEFYVFNTNEPRDRDYLKNYLGAEIIEKLDALEQYQYVKWEDGIDGYKIEKAPFGGSSKTTDS